MIGHRRQGQQGVQVPLHTLTDSFRVASELGVHSFQATPLQVGIQGIEALEGRHRHQEVAAHVPHQLLHLAFVVALPGAAEPVLEQVVGLQLGECSRALAAAVALVHEMMEARDERRLLNLQRQLSRLNLLIIDELGFVPLSRTGAELLFEVFSQRYERGSILVTTNLPFDEWTEVFGSERLTGALLDRLTHHVHILEMNGESYRLKRSRETASSQAPEEPDEE